MPRTVHKRRAPGKNVQDSGYADTPHRSRSPNRKSLRPHMGEDDDMEEDVEVSNQEQQTDVAEGAGGAAPGGVNQQDTDISPIPRPIRRRSLTFPFIQRSWEEIGTDSLYYVPLCMYPGAMMDIQMNSLWNQFIDITKSFRIEGCKFRLSNWIVVNDELQTTGGAIAEESSIVQRSKIIHFTPKMAHTTAFQFSGITPTSSYMVKDTTPDQSFLWNVGEYDGDNGSFEDLALLELANATNVFRGDNIWNGPYRLNSNLSSNAVGNASVLSYMKNTSDTVNHWPADAIGVESGVGNYTAPNISQAKNLINYEIISGNDICEYDVVTNLKGMPIDPQRYLLQSSDIKTGVTAFDTISMMYNNEGETSGVARIDGIFNVPLIKCWLAATPTTIVDAGCLVRKWPSIFDPLIMRDKIGSNGVALQQLKNKPLEHHFFTMIPIKKSNGDLMKQRASVQMEQEMYITFDFHDTNLISTSAPNYPMSMCGWRYINFGNVGTGATAAGYPLGTYYM